MPNLGDYFREEDSGRCFKVVSVNPAGSIEVVSLENPSQKIALVYSDGWVTQYGDRFIPVDSLFEELPNEVIFEMAMRLDLTTLAKLCSIGRRFNLLLCDAQSPFWQRRYLQDFGEPDFVITSWKEMYKDRVTPDVFVFGDNSFGQLGVSEQGYHTRPIQIPELKARSVSAGRYHSVVIDLRGTAWAFGGNSKGQLGLGHFISQYTPATVLIEGASPSSRIKALEAYAGSDHTVMVARDNGRQPAIWTFGDSFYGQLGLGTIEERTIPSQIPGLYATAGSGTATSSMSYHTAVIALNDSSVWTFGDNRFGQLGLGDQDAGFRTIPLQITTPYLRARAVSVGGFHTIVIDLSGKVWAFGSNNQGQLGLADVIIQSTPVEVPLGAPAKAVSAGGYHTIIVDIYNRVWVFGNNRFGQLGLGDRSERRIPTLLPDLYASESISAGSVHTVIVDPQGRVWVFGWNAFGQLGLGDERDRLIPTQIPGLRVNTSKGSVSAGFKHTIVAGKML